MQITKKFSTAAIVLCLTILGLSQGDQAFAQSGSSDVFVDGAPDRHVVVKGDTLWDISGKYLKQPWRWPEIWNMNRDQIRNPHWIYPGQVIILDKLAGSMRLSGDDVRLKPSIRSESPDNAIPSIPQDVIAPFLSRAVIVDSETLSNAPRIIAAKDRVILSTGDTAYASGITDESVESYQIFRPGRPLHDPVTKELLGYQADYLGQAQIARKGDPATIRVVSFAQEITVGDRMLPTAKAELVNYVPHAPDGAISGRVISTYGGVTFAGRNMVVALNRGARDGLEVGHVLAAKTLGRTIVDKTSPEKKTVKLPDERNGLIFVFRVFDKISYALVMDVVDPVTVGDVVTEP